MKNNIITGIIIVVLIIVGGVFLAARIGNDQPIPQAQGKYCGPDGKLTDTMPIQSHRSYCLTSDSMDKTYAVNQPQEYSFSIIDDQGNTLKNLETTHTKKMHVIMVRKDLKHFQHIHPEFNQATAQFSFSDVTFPADGMYRIFADFAPAGGQKDTSGMPLPVTLFEDVSAGTGMAYVPEALGSEEKKKMFDGYEVTFSSNQALVSKKEAMITLDLRQNSAPVTDLQEYLGALGHSVILRESNLDFIHAHPVEKVDTKQTGKISFMVTFPEAGKYKIFSQFQRQGKVFTTDFVVSVYSGGGSEVIDNPMH